jgi:hypothetical protein
MCTCTHKTWEHSLFRNFIYGHSDKNWKNIPLLISLQGLNYIFVQYCKTVPKSYWPYYCTNLIHMSCSVDLELR